MTNATTRAATLDDILSWEPCWLGMNPTEWSAFAQQRASWTLADILNLRGSEELSDENWQWLVHAYLFQMGYHRELRLAACHYATRAAKTLQDGTRLRTLLPSRMAISVSRRYAKGRATDEELAAARSAARSSMVAHGKLRRRRKQLCPQVRRYAILFACESSAHCAALSADDAAYYSADSARYVARWIYAKRAKLKRRGVTRKFFSSGRKGSREELRAQCDWLQRRLPTLVAGPAVCSFKIVNTSQFRTYKFSPRLTEAQAELKKAKRA